jgi:hypothetical protein
MTVALFAGIRVHDVAAARRWYLGSREQPAASAPAV